jgi:hypothetical protein
MASIGVQQNTKQLWGQHVGVINRKGNPQMSNEANDK